MATYRWPARIFLISLAAFSSLSVIGQTASFPTENASWQVKQYTLHCIGGSLYHVNWTEYLQGDTIIEGRQHSIVMLDQECIFMNAGAHCDEIFNPSSVPDFAIGGIREENGKVIFRRFDVPDFMVTTYEPRLKNVPVNEEITIYDLNWVAGDSVLYPRSGGTFDTFDVIHKDSLYGKTRIAILPRHKNNSHVVSLFEGVGGSNGLFSMYYTGSDIPYIDEFCFKLNGAPVLPWNQCSSLCDVTGTEEIPKPQKLKIIPNPANGIFRIEIDSTQSKFHLRILNQLGQVVYENRSYIKSMDLNSRDLSLSGWNYIILTEESGISYTGFLVFAGN